MATSSPSRDIVRVGTGTSQARAATDIDPGFKPSGAQAELMDALMNPIRAFAGYPTSPQNPGSPVGIWVVPDYGPGKDGEACIVQDFLPGQRKVIDARALATAVQSAPGSLKTSTAGFFSYAQAPRRIVVASQGASMFAGYSIRLRVENMLNSTVDVRLGLYRFGSRIGPNLNPLLTADTLSKEEWGIACPAGSYGATIYVMPKWNALSPALAPSYRSIVTPGGLSGQAAMSSIETTDVIPLYDIFGAQSQNVDTTVYLNFSAPVADRSLTLKSPDGDWATWTDPAIDGPTAATNFVAWLNGHVFYGGIYQAFNDGGGNVRITGYVPQEDIALRSLANVTLLSNSIAPSMFPSLIDLTGAYSALGQYPIGNRVITLTPPDNWRATVEPLAFANTHGQSMVTSLLKTYMKSPVQAFLETR